MEQDRELIKHFCRFCNKSFPCGRSLGGHMRSHVINSSAETDEKKLTKKKLTSINNGGISNEETGFGYGLRENPKKNCRFADSNEGDSLLHDKFCKQCGKAFQSWKALFGHMKCHSEKFSSNSLEEQDSWTSANQSETETPNLNRKKRSRRVTRYISTTTTTNSSLSMANNNTNNNASSSVSEIDHQEQEEVAMCLIMLSRDVGSKNSGLNSVDESSDNNFELLEAGSSIRSHLVSKNEGKSSWSNGGDGVKFRKLRNGKLETTILNCSSNSQFQMKQSDHASRNGSKLSKSDFWVDGFLGKSKVEEESRVEASEVELSKKLIKESGLDQAEFSSKKHNLIHKKLRNGKLESTILDSNSPVDINQSEYGASKLKKSDFRGDGFLGNDKSKKSKGDDERMFEASDVELDKNLLKENGGLDQAECSSKKQNLNPKKLRNVKLKSTILDSNSQLDGASGFSRNGSKLNKSDFRGDGFLGSYKSKPSPSKVEDGSGFEASEVELGKNLMDENGQVQAEFSSRKQNLSKKKYRDLMNNPELGNEKSSKFECTACNKAFHSYQALGGHRASHKKNKGCCYASNSIETEINIPPNPTPDDDTKLIKSPQDDDQEEAKKSSVVSKSKSNKLGGSHECPICFKVFTSGQALGGHKRSHLIGGGGSDHQAKGSSNQTQAVVIQKPISEIRDLLDLNLPAPVEEESIGNVGFKPWWVSTNHKPEPLGPLLGLLSS